MNINSLLYRCYYKNGGKQKMEKTSKKIVGGLVVVILVAAIGVVFASAQTDGTNRDSTTQKDFLGRREMCGSSNSTKPFPSNLTRFEPFCYDLTEEQQAELNETIANLRDQGANSSEIRAAIQEKLDEFGVFDQRLNNEINQTQQRLEVLNREKELRDQGYSWDEIRTMIQDEFGLQYPVDDGHGMPSGHQGFGRGPHRGFCGPDFGGD